MPALKTLLPYFFVAICAITLFVGGFYVGVYSFMSFFSKPTLTQVVLPETAVYQWMLTYLDKNEIDKAHAQMVLMENGNISLLEELSTFGLAEDTTRDICKLLKTIAKRRTEHPEKYPDGKSETELIINQKVKIILSNPKACQNS